MSEHSSVKPEKRLPSQQTLPVVSCASLDALGHFFAVFCTEFLEAALVERIADLLHQMVVEPEVMHDQQTLRQHLAALEQVAQIRAAEPAAGRTLTAFLDRAVVGLILRIHDVENAAVREQMTVARVPGRHDAVEEVDAARNALDDVARRADAHQIARLVLRRVRQDDIKNMVHDLGAFADGQTADRIARQIKFGDRLHVLDAQVIVGAALIDTEQQLMRIDGIRQAVETVELGLAASEPARRAVDGVLDVLARRRVFDALIKRHGDIRAEIGLDAHALLRTHEDFAAVDVRMEGHALLLDLAQRRKRENLKSARVGQHRAVPAHELVQTAHLTNDLIARANVKMVGIGQLDLAAKLLEVERIDRALDRAGRADVLKDRGLHHAVCRAEFAAARAAFGFD